MRKIEWLGEKQVRGGCRENQYGLLGMSVSLFGSFFDSYYHFEKINQCLHFRFNQYEALRFVKAVSYMSIKSIQIFYIHLHRRITCFII